jgi:antitoxin component YwqK of YwqJK toxin-antitoxin module
MDELHIAEVPFPSGAVKFRYSRVLSTDGKSWIRHGRFASYHENGQLASEVNYENGLEHGPSVEYYENGQVSSRGQYTQGKESGTWSFWAPDGQRERDAVYVNGVASEI